MHCNPIRPAPGADFAPAVRGSTPVRPAALLGRWWRTQPRVERRLGIDIGQRALQLVELQRAGADQDWQLAAWAEEPLPADADTKTLAAALRHAWRRSGSRSRAAVVALPDSAVLSRSLNLPAALSEAELESLLQLEVAQQGAWADAPIAFDFMRHGEPSAAGQVEVQLVACRRDGVEHYRRALQLAGLRAAALEIDSQALARVCARLPQAQATTQALVLLELREDEPWLGVLQGGRMIHRRSLSCPGAPTALADPAALLDELAAALQLFLASGPECPLAEVLLTGGLPAASLAVLADQVRQRLQLPCTVLAPLAGLCVSEAQALQPLEAAPSLLLACGLALREPRP